MGFRSLFARPTPYLAWLVLSAAGLAIARALDPYVFAFSAWGAALVSGALLLLALFMGWRAVVSALLAWLPTVLSFALLSTYKWA